MLPTFWAREGTNVTLCFLGVSAITVSTHSMYRCSKSSNVAAPSSKNDRSAWSARSMSSSLEDSIVWTSRLLSKMSAAYLGSS